MTVAYKYLDREQYAQDMVRYGTVKIGTLFGYAAEELERRSDSREGTYTRTVEQSQPYVDPVNRIVLIGNTFSNIHHSQDTYVYCASTELSRTAAGGREWSVRISDFERFAELMHAGLQHEHRSELRRFVRPVVYGVRSGEEAINPNEIPFLKDEKDFGFEREIRAVFYDPSPRASYHRLTAPGVVSVWGLRRFLEPVSIP